MRPSESSAENVWTPAERSVADGRGAPLRGGSRRCGTDYASGGQARSGRHRMTSRHDELFQPLDLAGLQLKNRIVLAPMTRARAGQLRIPNEAMARYYAQRAAAGLLITEATAVSAQANGWVDSPGVYTEEQAAGWRQVVEAVHAAGAPIFLQLWHSGRASHSSFLGGAQPVAPSAIVHRGDHVHTPVGKRKYEVPRALETEEIASIVADYAASAERAKSAGCDGVEVNAGDGWLPDQFLQSHTNQRTDRYGGSAENRCRFLQEIVAALLAVFPDRVGVRLTPNGACNDMGSPDYRDTLRCATRMLNECGLAYLQVVDGPSRHSHHLGAPMTLTEFRVVFSGPLLGNGGYTAASAAAALREGAADLIAFGRPFLSNPDLVRRFREGLELAPEADRATWYAGGPDGAGYNDWPPAMPPPS
jgi:N-ethylmaleimide reductase